MAELEWGRRYLMCRPDHFTVSYEINPHMSLDVRPDPELAREQYEGLLAALTGAGAALEFLPPAGGLPDLVFTANAGIVDGTRFLPSRFRYVQRQGETPLDVAWFAGRGFDIVEAPGSEPFEGAGDALPFLAGGDAVLLVAGYGPRSSVASHVALSEALGVPVRSVELVDPRYYHLDLVFCPLDERRALVAPQGLDRYGVRVLEEIVPEPILLTDDEAASFCANSVVVGNAVVMPACTPRLDGLLSKAGFSVTVAPVGEFLKAGGGCRCLTLALDVALTGAGRAAA